MLIGEQVWRSKGALEDQVMAAVQLDPQGAGTREVTVELETRGQAREKLSH